MVIIIFVCFYLNNIWVVWCNGYVINGVNRLVVENWCLGCICVGSFLYVIWVYCGVLCWGIVLIDCDISDMFRYVCRFNVF